MVSPAEPEQHPPDTADEGEGGDRHPSAAARGDEQPGLQQQQVEEEWRRSVGHRLQAQQIGRQKPAQQAQQGDQHPLPQ